MEGSAGEFAKARYVVCRNLLPEPRRSLLYRYALKLSTLGVMNLKDDQVLDTPSAGADFMMDGLLNDLLPTIEDLSGLELFPTYSYFRVYKQGDVLRKHTDRQSCEISITLSLGYEASEPWPIWIEGPGGTNAVRLEPGDGLLYRGVECRHWREALNGRHVAQVFLHYVDRHGPYAEWKYDKRGELTSRLNPVP